MAKPTRRSKDLPTAVMLATESALCPRARVASTKSKEGQHPTGKTTHRPHDSTERERQRERRTAQANPVEHSADRQTDSGAEERRPEIDVGVRHPIDLQIPQHRLGDRVRDPGFVPAAWPA